VILRHMPTLGDERFRHWFYQHWGRESCVIAARSRQADYPDYQQCLSVKAAWGGAEHYLIDGRRIAVDDAHYLVLNEGRCYGSSLHGPRPIDSFSIFFRPGAAQDVARCRSARATALLEEPGTGGALEFSEHLRPHDRHITPVLRFIQRHVLHGVKDEDWLEEQCYFLLERLVEVHAADRAACARLPARRPATRREQFRRIALAVNFIHACQAQPIGLAQIAAAACLSPYHCLRLFQAVHGLTPARYLQQQRLRAAERLLRSGALSLEEVAQRVGFSSRTTLYRHLRRRRAATR
jgi:AraC family transcriptional regulator